MKSTTKKMTIRLLGSVACLLLALELVACMYVNAVLAHFYMFAFNDNQHVYIDNGMVFGAMATGPGTPIELKDPSKCTSQSLQLPFVVPLPTVGEYIPNEGYLYSDYGTLRVELPEKRAGGYMQVYIGRIPMAVYSKRSFDTLTDAGLDCSI